MSKPRKKIQAPQVPPTAPKTDDAVDISGAWEGPATGPKVPGFGPQAPAHKAREKGQTFPPQIPKPKENQ